MMGLRNTTRAYGAISVGLHWVIAIAILYQIWIGYSMVLNKDAAAFQVHKSLGLTILALSILRLSWRFVDRPPPLPERMPRWQRVAARISHWTFYFLMIVIPLTGWLYISSFPPNPRITTEFWGLFDVPLLTRLSELPGREAIGHFLEGAHGLMAFGMLLLLNLHVGAALKHHFWNRDRVLHGMLPIVPARGEQSEGLAGHPD
jgi:cytochrome b561